MKDGGNAKLQVDGIDKRCTRQGAAVQAAVLTVGGEEDGAARSCDRNKKLGEGIDSEVKGTCFGVSVWGRRVSGWLEWRQVVRRWLSAEVGARAEHTWFFSKAGSREEEKMGKEDREKEHRRRLK